MVIFHILLSMLAISISVRAVRNPMFTKGSLFRVLLV
jgi:hypothetical protein